jgi:leucyl/phenylalanyl-tRNA--protein transferase
MPVFALDEQYVMFPDPEMANSDGLLALGGKLTPEWLILAYEMGIFPWFNEGDPILWWSVDPRSVLFPAEVHVSKSMRPYLNSEDYAFSFDTAFEEVIRHCSEAPGRGTKNTWITEEIVDAYLMLHDIGLAHSAEIREKGKLVGGLYGVSLGKAFFGESMFSLKNNMSKLAFIRLAENLDQRGFHFIDCQVHTKHLERLGAKPIPRKTFLQMLRGALMEEAEKGTWTT